MKPRKLPRDATDPKERARLFWWWAMAEIKKEINDRAKKTRAIIPFNINFLDVTDSSSSDGSDSEAGSLSKIQSALPNFTERAAETKNLKMIKT